MTAVRVLAILAAVGCLLAAAAYATTRPAPSSRPDPDGGEDSRPLRPRITVHPDAVTAEATAEFDFSQPGRPPRRARPGFPLRIECRLDDGEWEACVGPLTLTRIGRGGHRFAVRAVNRAGNISPVEDFTWRRTKPAPTPEGSSAPIPSPTSAPETPASAPVYPPPPIEIPATEEHPAEEPVEPPEPGLPFTIEQVGALGDLFPGAPAQTIGVRIDNPNPEAISVTSLNAAIAADPPGCPAEENFVLTPAALGPTAPLVVPAESSRTLAEAGVAGPTIAMVNLPTSQDACQAAQLQIDLTGEAGGG
jgi:hypothetical protein